MARSAGRRKASDTVVCAHCGTVTVQGKYCSECGKALIIAPAGMAAAPRPDVGQSASPGAPAQGKADSPSWMARLEQFVRTLPIPSRATASSPADRENFSVWWIIIPTLLFAIVIRDVFQTLLLAAIGAGLYFAQSRPEVPAVVRPYLPLLQAPIVFFFLGGSVVLVAVVVGGAFAAFKWHRSIFVALEPWWQLQQGMSLTVRRVVAFVVSLIVGYYFGENSSGVEWTYALLAIVIATVVTLLLIFTPPAAMRRPT
jgi:hypothetical protein